MTNFAVIFPGQGSQNTEMLDSYANVESFNSVINQASDILSYDIREITKMSLNLMIPLYSASHCCCLRSDVEYVG